MTFFLVCLNLTTFVDIAKGIEDPKNVLIINSYHQGLKWSNDETDGILDSLNKSNDNLATFVEYMDWKNYPNPENLQYLTNLMNYKYRDKVIDVVMATDDVALEFVLKNRETLFPKTPVVFCGVNQTGAIQITKGYKEFTGVLEEVDPTDTIRLALTIKSIYRRNCN